MIERYDVNEDWAHAGIIKAGDFCFLGYCVGNIGGTIEEQINGAFDDMKEDWHLLGLLWTMWCRWIACLEMFGISPSWKRSLKNGSTVGILCASPSRPNLHIRAEAMVCNSRLMVLRIAINN